MKKTVSVIGAGVAGLASAIRLQNAGYEVTLYEKESLPGGKMNQIKKDGFTFDVGPSIVMMPKIFNEIFEVAGRDPKDYIPMTRLDPMYSAFFEDERIDVSSDLVKLIDNLEGLSEEDALGFLSYLRDIYERFIVAKNYFIQRPFRKASDFYTPFMLRQAMKLKTFDSANHLIGKYVKDKRLQQILSFQTLYIGISPTNGPSLYTIIPMIEYLYGIWFIKGGMYTMASAMERLFIELGGTINYNTEVEEIVIEDKKATGIKVNGEKVLSDHVMCNADFPYAIKNLVNDKKAKGKYTDKKIDSMKYSCSCFVMYFGMDRKYDSVENVHNFVFSQDLDKNLDDIFVGKLLENASFYVYIASKMDEDLAPENKDGIYILLPVSDLSTAQYEWTEETKAYYRNQVLSKLKTIEGFETVEEDIISESYNTPIDFEKKYNAYNGATFGLRPTLTQSNHFRPQAKAKHTENLYFTGSSTHPGAGVPIVLTSAKIAAEELIKDEK